jgi:hypothetical protein
VTDENWPSVKLRLEHQEARVRNRYIRSYICIAFVLMSALSMLAQSDRVEVQRRDGLQQQVSDGSQPILTATLGESPAISEAGSESELPDSPSAAKADAPAATPAPTPAAAPAVKSGFHGAPPAGLGGPLEADSSVADRNYLMLTGGMFGASIANAELTIRCLEVHASCNDVPSSLNSRLALYGIGIPADIGVAYLSYYMKKKHSHIWYVPSAVVTGANIFLGVRAYRWTNDK